MTEALHPQIVAAFNELRLAYQVAEVNRVNATSHAEADNQVKVALWTQGAGDALARACGIDTPDWARFRDEALRRQSNVSPSMVRAPAVNPPLAGEETRRIDVGRVRHAVDRRARNGGLRWPFGGDR